MTENEKIRERLLRYVPLPHFSMVLADARYVASSDDWYVQDDKGDWYWLKGQRHGRHWVRCPLGPIL